MPRRRACVCFVFRTLRSSEGRPVTSWRFIKVRQHIGFDLDLAFRSTPVALMSVIYYCLRVSSKAS